MCATDRQAVRGAAGRELDGCPGAWPSGDAAPDRAAPAEVVPGAAVAGEPGWGLAVLPACPRPGWPDGPPAANTPARASAASASRGTVTAAAQRGQPPGGRHRGDRAAGRGRAGGRAPAGNLMGKRTRISARLAAAAGRLSQARPRVAGRQPACHGRVPAAGGAIAVRAGRSGPRPVTPRLPPWGGSCCPSHRFRAARAAGVPVCVRKWLPEQPFAHLFSRRRPARRGRSAAPG